MGYVVVEAPVRVVATRARDVSLGIPGEKNMKPFRPINEVEFLDAKRANLPGLACYCIECREEFSNKNTHSPAGWRDTQIIQMCEDCFDGMFERDEGEEG